MSGKVPSPAALMKPGADSEGTSTTSPSRIPNPDPRDQVPVDLPPITGSLRILKLKDVSAAPSKVTRGPAAACELRAGDSALEHPYAPTDFTSNFTSAALPSAQTDRVCNFCNRSVVGQNSGLSAHV